MTTQNRSQNENSDIIWKFLWSTHFRLFGKALTNALAFLEPPLVNTKQNVFLNIMPSCAHTDILQSCKNAAYHMWCSIKLQVSHITAHQDLSNIKLDFWDEPQNYRTIRKGKRHCVNITPIKLSTAKYQHTEKIFYSMQCTGWTLNEWCWQHKSIFLKAFSTYHS